MRHLKAALVGVIGGVLAAIVVFAAEFVYDERSVSAQMADCQTKVFSDRTVTVCDSAMQFGGVELAVAFVIGSAAGVTWFLRARRPV